MPSVRPTPVPAPNINTAQLPRPNVGIAPNIGGAGASDQEKVRIFIFNSCMTNFNALLILQDICRILKDNIIFRSKN